MDARRAQQIVQSTDKIEVGLRGTPVWIEEVDAETNTATVHMENNPADRKTVSLDQLAEMQ